jgi:hypothetical protein
MGRRRQWRRKHEIQKNPNPKRPLILHEELIFLIASTGSCFLVSRFCKFCSVAVSTSHSIRAAFEQNWRNIRAELEEPSSSIVAVFEQNWRNLRAALEQSLSRIRGRFRAAFEPPRSGRRTTSIQLLVPRLRCMCRSILHSLFSIAKL